MVVFFFALAARLVVGALVLMLEAVSQARLISASVFVPPSSMVSTLATLIVRGGLEEHIVRSMVEVAVSFGLAVVVGIPLGIVFWRFTILGKFIEPYLAALYALPLILFYPLFLVMFGIGGPSIVANVAIVALVPITMNIMVALTTVRPVYLKVACSFNASRRQLYAKVLLAAATPLVFTGLKMGFLHALVGTIGVEFVLADAGIGYLVSNAYNRFEPQEMYAYILVVVVVSALGLFAMEAVERRVRRELD